MSISTNTLVYIQILLFFIICVRCQTSYDYYEQQQGDAEGEGNIALFTLAFTALVAFILEPPSFATEGGLTLENVLCSYVGRAYPDALRYHCRRVILYNTFIGIIPLMYCIGLLAFDGREIFSLAPTNVLQFFAWAATTSAIGKFLTKCLEEIYTYPSAPASTNYEEMAAYRCLRRVFPDRSNLSGEIAGEVVNINTFRHNFSHKCGIVVTDNWIIYYNTFSLRIYRAEQCRLMIIQSEDFLVNSFRHSEADQLLNMTVIVPPEMGTSPCFKINNVILREMRISIRHPIEVRHGVGMRASKLEQFAKSFSNRAALNDSYHFNDLDDLDECLGCGSCKANTKIVHRCENVGPAEQRCSECRCKPFWCIMCLGKVFAGKQDPNTPEVWLLGKADCPTCRAKFCVSDVSLVEGVPVND